MAAALSKILAFEAVPAEMDRLRASGRRIVQSHGIFDLMHPGHIAHLEAARALGDVLGVSLTQDPYVQKGPGRPYFTETLRAMSLAALERVDYVVPVPFGGAVEAIGTIRPPVHFKAQEYEDPEFDDTGGLQEEMRAVERVGGELRFVGPIKFSSTRLLNLYFEHPTAPVAQFCSDLARRYTRKDLREAVESLASLRVLV